MIVDEFGLNNDESPQYIAWTIISRLAPYHFASYSPVSAHQLKNFTPHQQLSETSQDIAGKLWAESLNALSNYIRDADISPPGNGGHVNSRPTDFLAFEDLRKFEELTRGIFFNYAHDLYADRLGIKFAESYHFLSGALGNLISDVPVTPNFEFQEIDPLAKRPLLDWFLNRRVRDSQGNLIDKVQNEGLWLEARRAGITASDANKLIKLNGERRSTWWDVIASKEPSFVSPYFDSFTEGIERESNIADWVSENFQEEKFVHNSWLYASWEEDRFLATPDMIGQFAIAEIKVSTKPLEETLSKYRDQLQWQLFVMDCPQLLFVVENRHSRQIETSWIPADEIRQSQLFEAALEILDEIGDVTDSNSFQKNLSQRPGKAGVPTIEEAEMAEHSQPREYSDPAGIDHPKFGKLITSRQVSELTGFTMNQLRNFRQRPESAPFGHVRQGQTSLYRMDDVNLWLASNPKIEFIYVQSGQGKAAPFRE